MKYKSVFVIGPEGSGSRLVSKIAAHVLDITPYGTWSGAGHRGDAEHHVYHESLPAGATPVFPNINSWIARHKKDYDIHFILATRDTTISESSRIDRFLKSREEVQRDTQRAREMIGDVIRSDYKSFIWSYETFMLLRGDYVQLLYEYLGVESGFLPELNDGNRKRLERGRLPKRPSTTKKARRVLKRLIGQT